MNKKNGKGDPRDDTEVYSLGTILVKMGTCTRGEVEAVLERQKKMTDEELLGELLISAGLASKEQVEIALEAQKGLRSSNRRVRAEAAATLAEVSSNGVVTVARSVRRMVAETRKKRSGTAYPAVGGAALAVKPDE